MQMIFWFVVVCFRILNGCLRISYWYYDEIFQSIEVSHWIVFGYGNVTQEWNDKSSQYYGIRSSLQPLIYAIIYYLLKILGLDKCRILFVYSPRILNGLLAALMDYSVYRYSLLRFGDEQPDEREKRAQNVLFFSLFCSSNCFLGIRFFSNSLEAVLTSVAMWMWAEFEKQVRHEKIFGRKSSMPLIVFLWVILFTFFCRMSNAVFWVGFAVLFFFHDGTKWAGTLNYFTRKYRLLFHMGIRNYLLMFLSVLVVICIQIGLDRFVYGEFVVTVYKNFMFNIYEGRSSWWGISPWYFYVCHSIPFFLQCFMLPVLLGICTDIESLREFFVIVLVVVVLSRVPHKEDRFVYPVIPLFMCVAERGYQNIWLNKRKAKKMLMLLSCLVHLTVGWIYLRDVADTDVAETLPFVRDLILQNKTVLLVGIFHINAIGIDSFIHIPRINWESTYYNLDLRDYGRKKYPDCIIVPRNEAPKVFMEVKRYRTRYEEKKVWKKGRFDEAHHSERCLVMFVKKEIKWEKKKKERK